MPAALVHACCFGGINVYACASACVACDAETGNSIRTTSSQSKWQTSVFFHLLASVQGATEDERSQKRNSRNITDATAETVRSGWVTEAIGSLLICPICMLCRAISRYLEGLLAMKALWKTSMRFETWPDVALYWAYHDLTWLLLRHRSVRQEVYVIMNASQWHTRGKSAARGCDFIFSIPSCVSAWFWICRVNETDVALFSLYSLLQRTTAVWRMVALHDHTRLLIYGLELQIYLVRGAYCLTATCHQRHLIAGCFMAWRTSQCQGGEDRRRRRTRRKRTFLVIAGWGHVPTIRVSTCDWLSSTASGLQPAWQKFAYNAQVSCYFIFMTWYKTTCKITYKVTCNR